MLARWIAEHSRAVGSGGAFAGYPETTLVKVLRRTGILHHGPRLIQSFTRGKKIKNVSWVDLLAIIDLNVQGLPMESYRHYVAKKA